MVITSLTATAGASTAASPKHLLSAAGYEREVLCRLKGPRRRGKSNSFASELLTQ